MFFGFFNNFKIVQMLKYYLPVFTKCHQLLQLKQALKIHPSDIKLIWIKNSMNLSKLLRDSKVLCNAF